VGNLGKSKGRGENCRRSVEKFEGQFELKRLVNGLDLTLKICISWKEIGVEE
jgi:hypothetical protein